MPPSSKRTLRTRRETVNAADLPDSSPSRPYKRRKKIEPRVEHEPEPEPEPEPDSDPVPLPRDRSGIDLTDDQLTEALLPYLALPSVNVQCSEELSNRKHEAYNKKGVEAYAKLAGKNWTYYVKRIFNNIGRPPEGAPKKASALIDGVEDSTQDDEFDDTIHVDLGPCKVVSRKHAAVVFDMDAQAWKVLVHGRNGIRIDERLIRRGESHLLVSGEILEIGGVEMMFILPDTSRRIHKLYLQRAGLIQPDDDTLDDIDYGGLPSSTGPSSGTRGQNGVPGALPIAPAPPHYRRPGTPTSGPSKGPFSAGKSPYGGGAVFMNSDNVDLSLDSNKLVKPPYSYAQMIAQAILSGTDEKLNLNGIYTYITTKYSYYRHQPPGGWQNSIRHNLSLNKAYTKVARETDEPGKGMKWCIVPEARDEIVRTCMKNGRGGHRGSSVPASPANLDFLSRSRNTAGDNSARRKRSTQSPSNTAQYTPDRGLGAAQDLPGDGSPLPPHRKTRGNFARPENAPGSPVMSSSYMQDDGTALATPAPRAMKPSFAPPSTAQRPSQVMPTSSPAPFWKYADIGNTPMKAPEFESSPSKGPDLPLIPASSSPPPFPARRSMITSPTRYGAPIKVEASTDGVEEEEEQGFDLTKGFQTIGSFHAPTGKSLSVTGGLSSHS